MINKCGLYCNQCYAFKKECPGCEQVSGKPFWTEHIGGKPCPIYMCCQSKNLVNCGECSELPCKIWYNLKDPSLSYEQHMESINKRVDALKQSKD